MTRLLSNECDLVLSTPGFSDLTLTGDTTDDEGNTFSIEALDEDATWDNPVPVDVAVQRWMTDGAVASTQGHENREPFFKVRVSADTSAGLAAAEAALARRANKAGLLAWTPPEGPDAAPPTVFEVWTWHLEHTFDGMGERRLQRMYGVRMTAKPWVRSCDLTVVDALSSDSTPLTTQVDACTSTAAWTGGPNAPTTSGGAVRETNAVTFVHGAPNSSSLSLTRTGSVAGMLSTPYIALDLSVTGGKQTGILVSADGVFLGRVAQVGSVSYFKMPDGVDSFATLIVGVTVSFTHSGNLELAIADVSATDTVGGIGTRKALSRTIDVGGSVQTSGSIQVASPNATTLGNVIVYTCPNDGTGFTPPLRPYRISGNATTVDSGTVSGVRETIVNAGSPTAFVNYEIPVGLLPEGTYVLLGRFNTSTTAPLTAIVTAEGSPALNRTASITNVGGSWSWMVIGTLALPTFAVPSTDSTQTQTFSLAAAHAATVLFDDLYLFDIVRGDLSFISASTTRLWIDAPDADPARNRPAVYLGSLDDRTDAVAPPFGPVVLRLGDHDLDPGGASLFTITDGVADAAVSASFYRRWHTHAGS